MLSANQLVRRFGTSTVANSRLKLAIIGQSLFGMEVYKVLRQNGHEVVGVFTVPDIAGKPDPLAAQAQQDGVRVFKYPRWRKKGQAIPEVLNEYKEVGADLNVMPFCSQFIPMDVINHPKHGSIVYHPSILPRHRGASAINWTIMEGDPKAGFTIFWADDGLDTGPILLQRSTELYPNDTVDTIYNRFLYPQGINAMATAVDLVATGDAPRVTQSEEGATYDKMWKDKSVAKINWDQPAQVLHNFIRGNDKLPGAWGTIEGQQVTFYGSTIPMISNKPEGTEIKIEGLSKPAIVHARGLTIYGSDDQPVLVKSLQFEDGKMIAASNYGQVEESDESLELTDEEKGIIANIRTIWAGILAHDNIEDETDFFKGGGGSMDVARLVEEVKQKCGVALTPEEVYMSTQYKDFGTMVIKKFRGGDELEFDFESVDLHVNDMDVKIPHQLFINNQFVDSISGKFFKTINPTDESVICKVSYATEEDVNVAVQAAKEAFEGDWGKMNARDRGKLMYRLADLMEEHLEELATIETLDSGAVYTLALKTHIGMSIDTFRYFAGYCDKIHGKTIPINNARPSHNLCLTRREPLGVCGIVIPWNYPLMMLAWKMSSCLAAGNTCVLKPAEVTPLSALKFAELTVKAGFPKGVINILPGSGRVCGQAICDHPDIRKVGFTGSTPIGRTVMKSAAESNLKKVSLELGGKSPLIIFQDCDMDKAVRQGMLSSLFNKGENCIAAGRIFVEESIHDEYVARLVEEVKKLKIGDPFDRSTAHGPQNHEKHMVKLLEYVDQAVAEGATLVYGGKRLDRSGFFMEPAVLTNVADDNYAAIEESFGPVLVISSFKDGDVDGVLKRANKTEYGLASGVFTKDINKALLCSEKLDAGTVFVNTYNKTDVASPFGGFKQSGFGKDLGEEALNEYLKTKTVTIEYD
ncbi:Cytosolic 10-formyltetrahydrofolate dehydrogenase [Trichoplax sp. H2]|uniref:10-formyltetrahydrofolate dehydrogenase n=1 Tax=Trichoplax adhaerens TaxID=10228 RepID=B3RUH8_TRIAD|nr:hypothetical protein TRIADDRAFT_37496 [Trichoplax adhaerens]EDV25335.1 hypothetical protein TRIADDRAFT_37496 [Trichoplax adhaerens]RDD46072.1 Cytosolic 10-formyltetrahydrofolate dehydrogenase [Trichoplax sp. H2]|eukprot:XP_002111368.1 hypothetical protein TRIADDRAFT_37496 [Trichoplax adhaerens]